MELNEVVNTKQVLEYEFTFTSGMALPVTIDESLGDTVLELADRYEIHMAAKPSPMDSEVMFDEEDVTVYKRVLASVLVRKRTVQLATLDQKLAFKQFIHDAAKGVQ